MKIRIGTKPMPPPDGDVFAVEVDGVPAGLVRNTGKSWQPCVLRNRTRDGVAFGICGAAVPWEEGERDLAFRKAVLQLAAWHYANAWTADAEP